MLGSNSESAEEKSRRQKFYAVLGRIREYNKTLAQTKGDMKVEYDRAKINGISKTVIKIAEKWEKMTQAEIQAEVEDLIFVAKALGTVAGRQLSLIDSTVIPASEIAYDEGYRVGVMGLPANNPYQPGDERMQSWQQGVNDGNTFRNQEFKDAVDRSFNEDAGDDDDSDIDDDDHEDDVDEQTGDFPDSEGDEPEE